MLSGNNFQSHPLPLMLVSCEPNCGDTSRFLGYCEADRVLGSPLAHVTPPIGVAERDNRCHVASRVQSAQTYALDNQSQRSRKKKNHNKTVPRPKRTGVLNLQMGAPG